MNYVIHIDSTMQPNYTATVSVYAFGDGCDRPRWCWGTSGLLRIQRTCSEWPRYILRALPMSLPLCTVDDRRSRPRAMAIQRLVALWQ